LSCRSSWRLPAGRSIGRLAGLIAAIGLAGVATCAAQTLEAPTPRPGQGYFDRAPRGTQTLDISALTLGAYDDNVIAAENNTAVDPLTRRSGPYGGLTGTVAYARRFQHAEIGLSEASAVRYYPTLNDIVGLQHQGTVAAGFQYPHTQLTLSQSLGYLPYYSVTMTPALFGAGLAEIPPSTSDNAAVRREQRSLGSQVNFTQTIGDRLTVAVSGSHQDITFLHEPTGFMVQTLAGRVSRRVTRDVSLVAGYGFQQADYRSSASDSRTTEVQNFDLGLDYSHAFGPTHRTTVGFTSGSAMFRDPAGATRRQMIGSAQLNREIGRTWHATSAFRRGVGFVEGLNQPIFADSLSVSVGGTTSRRTELTFQGGYSRGDLGLIRASTDAVSSNVSSRLRVAITRNVAFRSEYLFYHYSFGDPAALPVGLPPRLDRHGLRFGLDLWLPVIR
jgi:hypothetical protein